jgi:hypothetical protein
MLDAVRDRCAPDAEFDFSAAYDDSDPPLSLHA